MNVTSVLKGFLEDAKAVVVRNDVLKNGKVNGTNGTGAACPKMTVLFARGTAEPGVFFPLIRPLLFPSGESESEGKS